MSNRLRCATCGQFVTLREDQQVYCRKCEETVPLAAAILALMAQADEAGQRLDVMSVRPGPERRLTYDLLDPIVP